MTVQIEGKVGHKVAKRLAELAASLKLGSGASCHFYQRKRELVLPCVLAKRAILSPP
jgi:hypothetical protein